MNEIISEYGNLALFAISFLSATVLPFSSELSLTTALSLGFPVIEAVIVASCGNSLACILNYGLGYFFQAKIKEKLKSSKTFLISYNWMHKYGYWTLLLSWVPIIGDPITILAGFFHWNKLISGILIVTLRIVRYAGVAWIFSKQ